MGSVYRYLVVLLCPTKSQSSLLDSTSTLAAAAAALCLEVKTDVAQLKRPR